MNKTGKRILAALLVLLLLAALALIGLRIWKLRQTRAAVSAAEELYTAGDFEKARDAFSALGLAERAADCDASQRQSASPDIVHETPVTPRTSGIE